MLFSTVDQFSKRKRADLLVVPYWQQGKKKVPIPATPLPSTHEDIISAAVEVGDFKGGVGETLLLYLKEEKEPRCLLLGLGSEKSLSVDPIRRAYAQVIKEGRKRSVETLNLLVPTLVCSHKKSPEWIKGMVEGLLLTNYQWKKEGILVEEEPTILQKACFIGSTSVNLSAITEECTCIAEGVHFARNLINANADLVTPHYLAEYAHKIAATFSGVKTTVLDQKKIESNKLGLLLAVARGAAVEPMFIISTYRGAPQSEDHTVLIGKGVTFDTGGLNIKTIGMETMRDDMSGAATVLATVGVAASLRLPVNVSAVVAATENAIDAKSYKPGDVYIGYTGISVEVGNTDAEGRLTLADAISYSIRELEPTRIIDFATLTGSIVVALGEEIAGLFSNNDDLARRLLDAGTRTSELLWRMPLHAAYKEMLRSDVADIKNIGGKPASAILAALFLQAFVENNIPWAHIDIAGPAFSKKEVGHVPKLGVGFGVRLMIDFLQHL